MREINLIFLLRASSSKYAIDAVSAAAECVYCKYIYLLGDGSVKRTGATRIIRNTLNAHIICAPVGVI